MAPHIFLMKPSGANRKGAGECSPSEPMASLSLFAQVVPTELWSSFTYQLCSSAKAALIFFTELSTSSLIIIRYLVRETVQRCKSFTDFSMLGPKIENKNCTEVRKLVEAFPNERARTVQHIFAQIKMKWLSY